MGILTQIRRGIVRLCIREDDFVRLARRKLSNVSLEGNTQISGYNAYRLLRRTSAGLVIEGDCRAVLFDSRKALTV